ncbi:Oidioi.mRNA.OKI2018_I69.chr1.g1580.t1.cds [Oikopleura dioica]|uniref:protein-tyrosine-phosphatase n=1 Tax=Oikopleura dioica TaxID=34765 RepID=A0ABN7SND3_OIKDI|nr:Oidioi.mRNA.OKI2018_I69.chr1.g1580.t1.cds [Oikopleura dioica]
MEPTELFRSDYHKRFVHKSETDYIKEEFQFITKKGNDFNVKYNVKEATKRKNEPFNRYRDILAYDETRVKLKKVSYINANWVKGLEEREFIATQGPKPETARHFWEMVIEQKAKVVVMLCKLREINKRTGMVRNMCYDYWPLEVNSPKVIDGEESGLPSITVTVTEEQKCEGYTKRQITVTDKAGHHRKITHFQMTSWPDYGVPDRRDDVFRLINDYRTVSSNDKAPIIMHCSAGVGRTGTIIAVDRVMQMFSKNLLKKNFNVKDLVIELRKQRMKMVQSEEQYRFLYPTVYRIFFDCDPPKNFAESSSVTLPRTPQMPQKSIKRIKDTPRNSKERPTSELHTPKRKGNMRRSKSHERLDFDITDEIMSETLRKAGKKPPKRTAGIHPGRSAQQQRPAETREKQRKEELIIKTDGDYSLSSVEDLSSELKGGPGPLRQHSVKLASTLQPKQSPKMLKDTPKSKSIFSNIGNFFKKKPSSQSPKEATNISAAYRTPSPEPYLGNDPPPKSTKPKWITPEKSKSRRKKAS